MTYLQIGLTILLLVVAVAHHAGARKLAISGYEGCEPSIGLILLLGMIWIEQPYRDGGIALLLGIFFSAIAGSFWPFVATGVAFGLAYAFVPGGGSPIILAGLAALFAWLGIAPGLAHARRLALMPRLEVGEETAVEVEAAGTLGARGVHELTVGSDEDPRVLEDVCAFWVEGTDGEEIVTVGTEELLAIETEEGTALIDPKHVDAKVQSVPVTGELGAALATRMGVGLRGEEKDYVTASWVADGIEVCVYGKPRWLNDPSVGTYRGGAQIPVFGEGSTLVDKGIAQVKREANFSAFAWSVWFLVIAAIAIFQVYQG